MLSNLECVDKATDKFKELFGVEYLRKNKSKISICLTVDPEEKSAEYVAFIAIKDSKDCPHMHPNEKGWTVYSELRVVRETGDVRVIDYQTETPEAMSDKN